MICINCPKGCGMEVSVSGEAVSVSGNACAKGEAYAKAEATNPVRIVTALAEVAGVRRPLPVKTKTPVPKKAIGAVLLSIRNAVAKPPVRIGDVIVPDAAGTGVDVVATANMYLCVR